MGIPIEVQGLDVLIPEVAAGKVILVESGPDPAKSYFVRRLALSAQRAGGPVVILTSRDRDEVERLLGSEGSNGIAWSEDGCTVVEKDNLRDWVPPDVNGGLVAIDSFSYLTLDLNPAEMATMMRSLRSKLRASGTTVILATDRGMFDPRVEAVTEHLSDGMIEFHSREAPEGVTRFLRVPKWMDGKLVDRNVYYDFDGTRLAIDLRRRVL